MKKRVKIGALVLGLVFGLTAFGGCKGDGGGSESDEPVINYNLKTEEIPFRDLCVLADQKTNTYYMIGFVKYMSAMQGIECYQSKDLENWGGSKTVWYNDSEWDQNWAPEIHEYNGKYYIFANLRKSGASGDYRGCYILKSDTPNGEYQIYSERITPENWECLDGTLYVEDGIPYMIYCREWTRMIDGNGEIYRVRLKDDLSGAYPGAEHIRMFTARDHKSSNDGITDGCWMYTASNGDLVMFWSKYRDGKYMVITSRSKSGKLDGEWTHDTEPLWTDDGGHAMVFKDFEGNLKIAFHVNSTKHPNEHPVIYNLEDNNGVFRIIK